jgi:hypothetical protein
MLLSEDWGERSGLLHAGKNFDYAQRLWLYHIDRTLPLSGSFLAIIARLVEPFLGPQNETEFYHSTHPFSSIVVI